MILKAKPGIDLEDMTDNDLIRLCVGAVCEHESIKDPVEVAELVRDLREQGGPSFSDDGLEIELYSNTYMLMDTDVAEAYAQGQVECWADEQAGEVARQLQHSGMSSAYISFDEDMFIRDCMMSWTEWVNSYDGTVNEYFPTCQYNDRAENFGYFSIWRTD